LVAAGAIVGGRTVLGRGVEIGADARVESSALLDNARVGARSTVRSAIFGPGAAIGDDCHLEDDVVLGAGASVGARNVLASGSRILPGVVMPEQAVRP
jgi:mannose-1-phosphate guanylyltransferase